MKKDRNIRKLEEISQGGFKGYPLATIAYYGPDNERATKVSVGFINGGDRKVSHLERFFSETIDIRVNKQINRQILSLIKKLHTQSVVIISRIIGCPHEEGIDYPKGEKCPRCPFWANRNRWTGKIEKQ